MKRIDLNGDMGESFGVYRIGADEQLVRLVTSANIACGYHAGDPQTMRATVRLCAEHGTAVGAHPGLPDLAGFGRRHLAVTPEEVYALVLYQAGALQGFAHAEGVRMTHVKPHGALYNMAAVQPGLAEAVAEAVYRLDPELILYGLAGSELVAAARRIGLRAAREAFADRTYEADGTLTPRSEPGAVVHDAAEAEANVIGMVKDGIVRSRKGEMIRLEADTVCIHGDGPEALEMAARLRRRLEEEGIEVLPPGGSLRSS
ncbi:MULTISPECIES: LamB/YcsF family protein [Paenibacillus]|uniref:LamB/YcsF family protein n=1 Tax=Paenibacillus TaxID=44249 RepID=UPI0022B8B245|nr:5-oxoprolinase subunit PxpA [Paenibacillus caseinilyticus]MCZ8523649.1 LamB/YcsF family protein [Paenibacillus caseinilyticus]